MKLLPTLAILSLLSGAAIAETVKTGPNEAVFPGFCPAEMAMTTDKGPGSIVFDEANHIVGVTGIESCAAAKGAMSGLSDLGDVSFIVNDNMTIDVMVERG